MKKTLFCLILLANLVKAEYVNGLIATINNQPITSYDLNKVMQTTHMDSHDAMELLIQERLEDDQIQNFGITANEYEVEQKIEEIAAQNKTNVNGLRNLLASSGVKFNDFKQNVEKTIKKEKLYRAILSTPIKNISPDNVRNFFEKHKDSFGTAGSFDVSVYTSKNKQDLENLIKNPSEIPSGVKKNDTTLKSDSLNPQLVTMLNRTISGSFTPVFDVQNGEYETIFIKSKNDVVIPDFSQVKQQITNIIVSQEQNAIIADYFNKVRVKAKIDIIKRNN